MLPSPATKKRRMSKLIISPLSRKSSLAKAVFNSEEKLTSMKRKSSSIPYNIRNLSPEFLTKMKKKDKSPFNPGKTKKPNCLKDKMYFYYNTYNEDFGFDKHMIFDSLRVIRHVDEEFPGLSKHLQEPDSKPTQKQDTSSVHEHKRKSVTFSDQKKSRSYRKVEINEWTRIADFILSPNQNFFKQFVNCVKKFQTYEQLLKKKELSKKKSCIRKQRRGSKASRRFSASQNSTSSKRIPMPQNISDLKPVFKSPELSKFKDESSAKSISSCDTPTRAIEKYKSMPQVVHQKDGEKKQNSIKTLIEFPVLQEKYRKTLKKSTSPRAALKKLSRNATLLSQEDKHNTRNTYSRFAHTIESLESKNTSLKMITKRLMKSRSDLRELPSQAMTQRIKPSLFTKNKGKSQSDLGGTGRNKMQFEKNSNKLINEHSKKCLAISPTPSYQRKALNLAIYSRNNPKPRATFSSRKIEKKVSSQMMKKSQKMESSEEKPEKSHLIDLDLKGLNPGPGGIEKLSQLQQLIIDRPKCILKNCYQMNHPNMAQIPLIPAPKRKLIKKKMKLSPYRII
ncbi:unnamed protein product [Moneuplotes crassus]|uniref:Uncharacterized protein n=1 Tax=Euplotes crassus TaxID=5936 RepID=A0AAD2DA80_EUPCR|nr:unnamed protein product [Moneuplotes crassus]